MRVDGRIREGFLSLEGSVIPCPGSNPNRFLTVRILPEAGNSHWLKGRDVFDAPGRPQSGLSYHMGPVPDVLWLMVRGLEIPQFVGDEMHLKVSGETR
ncbi:MAG: hypothetical protein CMO35_05145 [Verrucomicrobiaceae bacterium]|nr:hypothetical protein [Verrucomicrobiaceae bacterium]